MNGVPMKFNYSKTINEQLPTFNYYKDRYACYELEIIKLRQENQELKKQLEEYKYSHSCSFIDTCKNVKIANYNQQKEFIEYLEKEININPYDISDYDYEDIINTILSKYKEIIGVSK